ncbi:MAG: hypothetical protein QOE14_2627 [Humisphaera sp.]|nr:hypothetical protein [Humisphaera sp.]
MPTRATDNVINSSPPVVALAGWALPGLGYWLIGQRGRAITCGITIILVFLAGILIAGVRVVQAPDMSASGNPFQRILQRPWFIGQVLTGPIGITTAMISEKLAASPTYRAIESKARLAEIGTLYTAVAGMLNLLTIIDASHRAARIAR